MSDFPKNAAPQINWKKAVLASCMWFGQLVVSPFVQRSSLMVAMFVVLLVATIFIYRTKIVGCFAWLWKLADKSGKHHAVDAGPVYFKFETSQPTVSVTRKNTRKNVVCEAIVISVLVVLPICLTMTYILSHFFFK